MKSILSSLSRVKALGGGGKAQPDASQVCLARLAAAVKGERSEFILPLTLRGATFYALSKRKGFPSSYQPLGRRLSLPHVAPRSSVAPLRPVLTIGCVCFIVRLLVSRGSVNNHERRALLRRQLPNITCQRPSINESLLTRSFYAT